MKDINFSYAASSLNIVTKENKITLLPIFNVHKQFENLVSALKIETNKQYQLALGQGEYLEFLSELSSFLPNYDCNIEPASQIVQISESELDIPVSGSSGKSIVNLFDSGSLAKALEISDTLKDFALIAAKPFCVKCQQFAEPILVPIILRDHNLKDSEGVLALAVSLDENDFVSQQNLKNHVTLEVILDFYAAQSLIVDGKLWRVGDCSAELNDRHIFDLIKHDKKQIFVVLVSATLPLNESKISRIEKELDKYLDKSLSLFLVFDSGRRTKALGPISKNNICPVCNKTFPKLDKNIDQFYLDYKIADFSLKAMQTEKIEAINTKLSRIKENESLFFPSEKDTQVLYLLDFIKRALDLLVQFGFSDFNLNYAFNNLSLIDKLKIKVITLVLVDLQEADLYFLNLRSFFSESDFISFVNLLSSTLLPKNNILLLENGLKLEASTISSHEKITTISSANNLCDKICCATDLLDLSKSDDFTNFIPGGVFGLNNLTIQDQNDFFKDLERSSDLRVKLYSEQTYELEWPKTIAEKTQIDLQLAILFAQGKESRRRGLAAECFVFKHARKEKNSVFCKSCFATGIEVNANFLKKIELHFVQKSWFKICQDCGGRILSQQFLDFQFQERLLVDYFLASLQDLSCFLAVETALLVQLNILCELGLGNQKLSTLVAELSFQDRFLLHIALELKNIIQQKNLFNKRVSNSYSLNSVKQNQKTAHVFDRSFLHLSYEQQKVVVALLKKLSPHEDIIILSLIT